MGAGKTGWVLCCGQTGLDGYGYYRTGTGIKQVVIIPCGLKQKHGHAVPAHHCQVCGAKLDSCETRAHKAGNAALDDIVRAIDHDAA